MRHLNGEPIDEVVRKQLHALVESEKLNGAMYG